MSLKLWHKVIIGMVLGAICGFIFGKDAEILKPIGTVYINCLKMVIVPLIFFAVLYGVTNISDASTLGRVGLKALSIYSCTTIFAVTTGLLFASFFKPGIGININLEIDPNKHEKTKELSDILMNIIPSNPVEAMATSNTLQIVVFAFFTGFCLVLIGERGREVKNFVSSAAHLVFKMIELIIKLTPYGVFAIMAWVIGEHGIGVMVALSKFLYVVLAALFTQYMIFGVLLSIVGLKPWPFYRKMVDIQTMAFATSSSKATLALSMQDVHNKLGVSKETVGFVLPLGASMNMDATAIYLGITTVFFAQIIGMTLTPAQYCVVIFTATIGSIGAAGFPGGGIVMMSMVLSSVGIPLECISIIIGIDRILDMIRTTINITGDCAVTVIVDKLENTLDKKRYYAKLEDIKNKVF